MYVKHILVMPLNRPFFADDITIMLIYSLDGNPQMHMQQQQHLLQQQAQRAHAARSAMMAQQFNTGIPMGMPNGIPPQMNTAQFPAMRGPQSMRSIALPQHLQQQQQQANLGAMAQEQAQQQAQQQQVIQNFTILSSPGSWLTKITSATADSPANGNPASQRRCTGR